MFIEIIETMLKDWLKYNSSSGEITMKCTVKIGKRNSSVKIRDDLLALWYILNFPDEEISYSNVQREVRKFISRCLVKYKPKNPYYVGNSGLTDYVNSCVVQEVLERPERIRYRRCLKMLGESLFKNASLGNIESLEKDAVGVAERDLILRRSLGGEE